MFCQYNRRMRFRMLRRILALKTAEVKEDGRKYIINA
jgi:hypothetical protein